MSIQAEHGNKPIVFIFDNLEKIEGADETAQLAVQRSVEFIFQNHRSKLELPYIHAIYTIPPWLKFLKPLEGDTTMLSGVRLWHNDATRSEKSEGVKRLRELLKKRFEITEKDGWQRFFGTTSEDAADILIRASGGDIRDLFRMIYEASVRTKRKLPVSVGVLDSAARVLRDSYLPISESKAVLIEQVAQNRTVNPEIDDIDNIKLLIDSHMILFFRNGKEWYDANPTILPEAQRIVEEINKRNDTSK